MLIGVQKFLDVSPHHDCGHVAILDNPRDLVSSEPFRHPQVYSCHVASIFKPAVEF